LSPEGAPGKEPEDIAVGVIRDGAEVLVTRRGPGVAFAGYDEFPGGHRERGEDLEECLRREVQEETGLQVETHGLLNRQEVPTSRGVRCLWFFDCTLVGPRPSRLQGSAADPRWVSVLRLHELRFPPANAAVLELLTPKTLPLSDEA